MECVTGKKESVKKRSYLKRVKERDTSLISPASHAAVRFCAKTNGHQSKKKLKDNHSCCLSGESVDFQGNLPLHDADAAVIEYHPVSHV